jgi:hypothetical protein
MDKKYTIVLQKLQKNCHIIANNIVVVLENDECGVENRVAVLHIKERFSNTALLSSVIVLLELARMVVARLSKSILSVSLAMEILSMLYRGWLVPQLHLCTRGDTQGTHATNSSARDGIGIYLLAIHHE